MSNPSPTSNQVILAGGHRTVVGIPDVVPTVTVTLQCALTVYPGDTLEYRIAGALPPISDTPTMIGPGVFSLESWSLWQPYQPTTLWRLTLGEGFKSVSVQYRTVQSNGTVRETSPTVSDTINLSMWWPEGYLDPAFEVQRDQGGAVSGGDYVRGSDWFLGTLAGTTTPAPTNPASGDTWAVGSPVPSFVPPFQPAPLKPGDSMPALVPAALGHAVRWTGSAWTNIGPLEDIAHTALRYPKLPVALADVLVELRKTVLHVRPISHEMSTVNIFNDQGYIVAKRPVPVGTVEVTWAWPPSLPQWSEVALVRSGFGRPSTVNDGITVYRKPQREFFAPDPDDPLITPAPFNDEDLPSGRWYYYTLFFKVTPVLWVSAMSGSCLLPNDYHHAEHLWNSLPPYYQWTDDNYRVGAGFLRQFLSVYGYELDTVREYVESWQELYHNDFSPIRLLRHLGKNLGLTQGDEGEIRFRSVMSRLGFLYDIRGTTPCLEQVITAMSKCECEVTAGENLLLLPDDSDFFTGTGDWAPIHPDTDVTPIAAITPLQPEQVKLSIDAAMAPPVGYGRRVMKVEVTPGTPGTQLDMLLTIGNGIAQFDREIVPLTQGVPVKPAWIYGFSAQLYTVALVPPAPASLILQLGVLFFDRDGEPAGSMLPPGPNDFEPPVAEPLKTWTAHTIQVTAPADAVYAVPTIRARNVEPLTSFWVAAAMFYVLGETGVVAVDAPDRYLTLGEASELLGDTQYVIGSKESV